jgi:formylmethanofuran dehydrogenase subunit E
MSSEKDKKENHEIVKCCVKNCSEEIPKEKAIIINGQYFCGVCGVAYYRSILNI